jgi:cell division protein FtsL
MKILAVLLGLCLVFVFVWERVDMVRVGYQIERLKHNKTVLERQRDELKVQFSTLSASGRIAHVATKELGMELPQQGQVVLVQFRPGSIQPVSVADATPIEVRVAKNDLLARRY